MEFNLTPINVAMLAPTGAGKTSLLSTVVKYIEDKLNVAEGFRIKPCNRADEVVLNTFNTDLRSKIDAEDFHFDAGFLPGNAVARKFEFEITLTSQANTEVKQKFVIMDIPGVWLDPERRTDATGWEEFKKHLYNSRIIWIPIEATVLMEVNQNSAREKGLSSRISCREEIEKLVKEWAEFRQKDKLAASANFVITKCETYHSKSERRNKDNELINTKADQCRDLFTKYYGESIELIRRECPSVEITYIPVETIGCVKLIDSDWISEEGKRPYLSCSFTITPPNKRQIAGAESLVKSILDYSVNQIKANLDDVSKGASQVIQENENSIFKRLKNWWTGKTELAKYNKSEIEKITPSLLKLGSQLNELERLGDEYRYYRHL